MKDSKTAVRYLGYKTLPDGGRGFDFSFGLSDAETRFITVEAPVALFRGPEQMAIQEGAGICFETLKGRVENSSATSNNPPPRFKLTMDDIAQYRKVNKPAGRRR